MNSGYQPKRTHKPSYLRDMPPALPAFFIGREINSGEYSIWARAANEQELLETAGKYYTDYILQCDHVTKATTRRWQWDETYQQWVRVNAAAPPGNE